METFFRYAEEHGDTLWTRKIYRDAERFGDYEERSERLLKVYEEHVDLVEDLVLELTRAANYICDRVRETLDPSFRLDEGAATATYGPTMELKFITVRPEYRNEERTPVPYPGLEKFKSVRLDRDFCFARSGGDD